MTQMHMECVYSPAKKGKKAPGYSLRCLYPAGTRSTLWDIRSDEPLQLVGAGRGDPVNLVERTDVRCGCCVITSAGRFVPPRVFPCSSSPQGYRDFSYVGDWPLRGNETVGLVSQEIGFPRKRGIGSLG
jgi:hypothetical protein